MNERFINPDRIISIFDEVFGASHQTRLLGNAPEPQYLPEEKEIYFRADYVSSALHEVAHWRPAGFARRQLTDYGYWYEPVRNRSIQQQFEIVEARPQALEWIFSIAAGMNFRVSADNHNLSSLAFRRAVRAEVKQMLVRLPRRAKKFADALSSTSRIDYTLCTYSQRLPD